MTGAQTWGGYWYKTCKTGRRDEDARRGETEYTRKGKSSFQGTHLKGKAAQGRR